MFVARDAGRTELETLATTAATGLLMAEMWADAAAWDDNRTHVRALLGYTSSVTRVETVQATLRAALAHDAELLPAVLLGMAQWIEQHDIESIGTVNGVTFQIEDLPVWFPSEALASVIRAKLPHVTPADEDDSARYADDIERLASQVLWLTRVEV